MDIMASTIGCAFYRTGRHLAKAENANIIVVELFALLHDTQRQNEDDDPEHGLRGEQFAQTF